MKTDDIFEAITDIDNKFLEEAHPTDFDSTQPIVVRPAPKKPLWKTLVPIAACLAVVCTAGTFGVRYLRGHGLTETSDPAASDVYPSSNENFKYPDKARFVVSEKYYEDPSLFNNVYQAFTIWDNEDTYAKSYKELAAQSDLIVAGEFADNTHQTQDPDKIYHSDPEIEDLALNYLRVENVIKGDIKAGQYVLINQGVLISAGGDNAVQINSGDRLTPMFKGDRWIYFLKKNGDYYEPVNGPQGRYPMPGSNNVDVSNSGEIGMVDKYCALTNSAPARDEIYDTVVALLQAAKPKLEEIPIPENNAPRNYFDMEEFPEYDFAVARTNDGVSVNGYLTDDKVFADVEIIMSGDLENLFLCDLNGDGKREICATVVNDGVRSVDVIDFANDKWYRMQGKPKREYYLKAVNEELTLFESETAGDDLAPDFVTFSELSLDKMSRVIPNSGVTLLEDEKRFMLTEFPDKTFEIIDDKIVMDDINAPEGTMRNSVISGMGYYLTDLNGDGKREICAEGAWGSGIINTYINIYDIANDESYSKATDAFEGLLQLGMKDGKLYAVTIDYKTNEESSREPLTLDILGKVPKIETAFEEIPLFIDQTFTVADFPGVSFTVETSPGFDTFSFRWKDTVVENSVDSVYLYDADGDGKREICMRCWFSGIGIVRVYGYMDNGEMGCAAYYEDGGCCLDPAEDGTLEYRTNDETEPFKFSKSDLRANLEQGYSYEAMGSDRSLDLSKIAPELDNYDISITDCTLKISNGENNLFYSGTQLSEMYTIYNGDEPSLILVFTEMVYTETEIGKVSAIRLSKNTAEQYDLEKGATLRPTAYELHIVNPDGTEEPFKFPDSSERLHTLPLGE